MYLPVCQVNLVTSVDAFNQAPYPALFRVDVPTIIILSNTADNALRVLEIFHFSFRLRWWFLLFSQPLCQGDGEFPHQISAGGRLGA